MDLSSCRGLPGSGLGSCRHSYLGRHGFCPGRRGPGSFVVLVRGLDHVNGSVLGCEPALDDELARMSSLALVREPDHVNESVLVFGSGQQACESGRLCGSVPGAEDGSAPVASVLRER